MVAKLITHVLSPKPATASPLLRFIAGGFADLVAHLWRPPHGEFFALPAARRHAAAIGLANLAAKPLALSELRRLVEFARDAAVAEALAGELAPGLMRILSKGGEVLWKPDDYAALLTLLADPMANEVLRHMDGVSPTAFAPLAELPPALRVASIVRVVGGVAAAADLALAFRLAVRMRSPEDAGRIARRWGAGGEARQLFERARADLTPDAFRPADPAPRLDAPFTRIVSRKQLEQVALEFRNCLADHAQRIAEGRMAVFVWRDEAPAAVALNWDVAGWRLAEAKAADNLDLEEGRLRELVRQLEAHNVRTGPSVQALASRLDDHGEGTRYASHPGRGFVEQLALGDLWN